MSEIPWRYRYDLQFLVLVACGLLLIGLIAWLLTWLDLGVR